MRLYGRQSRVRARRRRVLLSLGIVAGLLAIPLGHLVMQRGSVVHGVRVAGVPLGGASRAQAEREISAAVGDELQREVTVTVAGRSATLSPYALGVRVDAARTATAALEAGRVRGGLLFSLGYSRSIAPVLSYPDRLALPVELANVTQAPVERAARAQAERRRDRDSRQGRRRLRSRRGAAGDHARRARRSRGRVAAHRPDAGCDLDRLGAPRQGPCRAAAVGTDRVHAARTGRRPLARAAARSAPERHDLRARDRRAVRSRRRSALPCGRRSPTTSGPPRTPAGRSWAIARACSRRSAASTSTRAAPRAT